MDKNPVSLLQFETNTACNAHCTFCMHQHMTRQGTMPLHKRIDLLYHLAPRAYEICPFGMQEPLLDPYLSQTLANCKLFNPKCHTIIYSNMSVYPQHHWKQILHAGTLDELVISFYGVTPQIYAELQPPLDYEQTVANIKRLVKYKRRLRWHTPQIKLEFVVTPETWPHRVQMVKAWRNIVDHIGFVQLDSWGGNIPVDFNLLQQAFGVPYPRVPCHRLWTTMNIHCNGNINMCCLDYNDDYVVGNVFEDWDAWWTSKQLEELRQLHIAHRWDEIPLCKECSAYRYNVQKGWVEKWLTTPSTVSSVISP